MTYEQPLLRAATTHGGWVLLVVFTTIISMLNHTRIRTQSLYQVAARPLSRCQAS
jgi:hypothetical protein